MAVDLTSIGSAFQIFAMRYRAIQALTQSDGKYTLTSNPSIHTHEELRDTCNTAFDDTILERDLNAILQANLKNEIAVYNGMLSTVKGEFDNCLNTVVKSYLEMGDGSADVDSVLEYLADYMEDNSKVVLECSVAATAPTADGDNIGSGYIKVSKLRENWGADTTIDNETLYNADISAEVTSDRIGTATGDGAATIIMKMRESDYNVDKGSISLTAVTDTTTQVSGTGLTTNRVSDSSFEEELASGSGGFKWTSGNFALASSAPFIGDLHGLFASNANCAINQPLGSDDNNVMIGGEILYAEMFVKSPSGSTGTVHLYANGTDMSKVSIASANSTASGYTQYSGFFRLPRQIGTDCTIYASCAGNDQPAFIDCIRLTKPSELSGMLAVSTRGQTDFVNGDRWTGGSTTNDEAGAIQRFLRDAYDTQLPSDSVASTEFSETNI